MAANKLHWQQMEYQQLYERLIDRVLKGKGESALQQRYAAFNNDNLPQALKTIINKVANEAYKVTDNDVTVVKEAGINEDQLFELIICAAVGQASRQCEIGLTALAEATQEGAPDAS